MSEKKYPEKKSSIAPLIATIIVGIAAIAAVIMLIIMSQNERERGESSALSNSSETPFQITQALIDECSVASHDLLQDSYQIIRLFITEGLPHKDEPYGNDPEDGIYTVDSKEYTSLGQIEELVRSVYVESEAERILHNIDGNGMEVYKNREVLTDIVYTDEPGESESRPAYIKETVLGINAGFEPDTSYDKSWESSRLEFMPVSETECKLTIFLGADESTDLSNIDPNFVLETTMIKQDGRWLLAKLVY